MTITALIVANAVGWATVQLGIARFFVILDPIRFHDLALYQVGDWEIRLYRTVRVRSWKRWLPDGATWVGSNFSKKRLKHRDADYLCEFEIETRRAELSHWIAILTLPGFLLWNPFPAWPLLSLYALGANLPCIVAQRYNRHAIRRIFRSSHSDVRV